MIPNNCLEVIYHLYSIGFAISTKKSYVHTSGFYIIKAIGSRKKIKMSHAISIHG